MSPERISGNDYSYESDIWAVGVTLWECSVGNYPYGQATEAVQADGGAGGKLPLQKQGSGSSLLPEEEKTGMTFWDLLFSIVECPPPELPAGSFSEDFCALGLGLGFGLGLGLGLGLESGLGSFSEDFCASAK